MSRTCPLPNPPPLRKGGSRCQARRCRPPRVSLIRATDQSQFGNEQAYGVRAILYTCQSGTRLKLRNGDAYVVGEVLVELENSEC
jgi:hypothetical protein